MQSLTKEIIEAAIAGFEGQKQKIDVQIAELRAQSIPKDLFGKYDTPAPAL
jgi:hypothetical protein